MRIAKWAMILMVLVLSVSLVLGGCSSPTTPAPSQTSKPPQTSTSAAPVPTTAPPASTTAATNDKVAAAIKEGSLNWIDAVVDADSGQKMIAAFKQAYKLPDSFKISHQQLGTGLLSSRVQEEVKASTVTIDLFAVADSTLLYALKDAGALLQYDSPEYKNYTHARTLGVTYEPGYWQSAIAYAFAPITNPKTYPKPITSWLDLLAPDLKGQKIDWPDPTVAQSPLYFYIGLKKTMPATYFSDLVKQQMTTGTSSANQTNRISLGETVVAVTNPFRIVQSAATTGVALKANFPKEGVVLLGHPYGILTKSPHPNAAKLFIDWLYGEQGMKMYIDLVAPIALRDGFVVPDSVKPYSPPVDSIKTIPMDWKSLDSATLEKYRIQSAEVLGK